MSNVLELIATAESMQAADPLSVQRPEGIDTYEDADNPDVRGPWEIKNVSSADWAMARLAALRAEREQLDELERAAVARVHEKADKLRGQVARGESYFEFKLLCYAVRNKAELLGKGSKKSRTLINGTLGWKTHAKGGRLAVEDKKALEAWLMEQPVERGLYRVRYEAEMAALQEAFKADGVIPDGCKVEEETEEPYVKIDAPEAALAKGGQ
jgi:phage host-nuclease inhibitor protein Gam